MDACARSTTIIGQPDRIDDGIALVSNELMSMMTGIDGCLGLSLLVDRSTGRCIATSSWESAKAMRASDEHIASMRDEIVAATRGLSAEFGDPGAQSSAQHTVTN